MRRRSLWQSYRQEFGGYTVTKFRQDLLAGITVAAVALPLALAFGVEIAPSCWAKVGVAASTIRKSAASAARQTFCVNQPVIESIPFLWLFIIHGN